MNIQITGASGSGKTTLGKELSKKLKINFIDTDDILWVWEEKVQPYTIATDEKEACKILEYILLNNVSTVASGIFYPWSEKLIDMFDLLIVVETEKEIRKERIIKREYEMYGDRAKNGGDMYNQFNEFLNWALDYDNSDDESCSKNATYKWIKKFKCPVIYIYSNKNIKDEIEIVLKEIEKIKKF